MAPPADNVAKLYPFVNEEETPLPREWTPINKGKNIRLTSDKRTVYTTHRSVKPKRTTSSVFADYYIPNACGFYYYELTILKKPLFAMMEFGLTEDGSTENWGYLYNGSLTKNVGLMYFYYGEVYKEGDIVGCAINMINRSCFFTKNGRAFGFAFKSISPGVFPYLTIELGITVRANFGQEPFKFNVSQVKNKILAKSLKEMECFDITQPLLEIANKLVLQHLVNQGYEETAEIFARKTGQTIDDKACVRNRSGILMDIRRGKIEAAIEKITALYPGLLEQDQILLTKLRCHQIMEMTVQVYNHYCSLHKKNVPTLESPSHSGIQPEKPGNSSKTQDLNEPKMEVDNDHFNLLGNASGKSDDRSQVHRECCAVASEYYIEIIDFAKETEQIIKDMPCTEEKREESQNFFNEAFSFLAYRNPWDNPYKSRLESNCLAQLSNTVNEKLLKYHKMPNKSYLLMLIRHAENLMGIGASNGLFQPVSLFQILDYHKSITEPAEK